MDHQAISIDEGALRTTLNGRLEALKERNFSSPDNQPSGDHDLTKFMDPELYEATKTGDADKFIDALEAVSESNKLALSLIFDQVTPSGNSLLHVAASSGNEDIMKLILSHFPDLVTQKNLSEDTPLHVAVQNERFNATEMLIQLEKGWKIMYWKNKDSKSPLYLAAETGHLEILKLLLEASPRDEAKIQGRSPVLAAIEVGKSDMLKEIVDRLPKLLHVRDEDGSTPLHCAAKVGNVGAVQLLLSKCRNLALQTDKNGSYPIHIACEGGNVDIISELRKTWPDLAEIKNKKDQNILHVAAEGGKIVVVKHILNNCKWPEKLLISKDVNGNTPRHLASMHNHSQDMLDLMRDVARKSGSLPPPHEAIREGEIVIEAGESGSLGQDLQATREGSSGKSQLPSTKNNNKEVVESLLVAATLVASITFTAGITLPSGYNGSSDPHPGVAIMLYNLVFQIFVIFDAVATYCSILSVVLLLRVHKYPDREKWYTNKAELLLLLAVNCMTAAFSAALILAVRKLPWLLILLLCLAGSYLAVLLAYLIEGYAFRSNYFRNLNCVNGVRTMIGKIEKVSSQGITE